MGPAVSSVWTWAPGSLNYRSAYYDLEVSEPYWTRALIWVEQKYQWDCGIACTLMVLKWAEWLGKHGGVDLVQPQSVSGEDNNDDNSNISYFYSLFATGPQIDNGPPKDLLTKMEILRKQAYEAWPFREKPLWTIDIALLLLGPLEIGPSEVDQLTIHSDMPPFQLRMYTSCKGVSDDSQSLGWYQADLATDQSRVDQQFRRAASLGINVIEETLSLDFIRDEFLRNSSSFGFLAIILIDNNRLKYGTDGNNREFVGHYILLIGFDRPSQRFLYLNPDARNSGRGPHSISMEKLECARSAKGTDCDAILCWWPSETRS